MTLPHQHNIPTNATNDEVALIEEAAQAGNIKTFHHRSSGGECFRYYVVETLWDFLTWEKGCNNLVSRLVIPTGWSESKAA